MSLHNVLVFVHILAAFLMIGGITVQRFGLMSMRSASPGEVLGAYKTYATAPRVVDPSVPVMALSGLALAWEMGYSWRALWVSASVVLSVALMIWRGAMVLPPLKPLEAAALQAAADPAAHSGALLAAARHPKLHLGHLGIELINGAILVLMIFKPMSL